MSRFLIGDRVDRAGEGLRQLAREFAGCHRRQQCVSLGNAQNVILGTAAVTHATKAFVELSYDDWHAPITVTLDGAFHCTQAVVPAMIRAGGGSIVNMGGLFGHMPIPNRAPTAAAKAGLAGLTRALALELAEHNITVNYVAPGPANTVRDGPFKFDTNRIPFGRFAEPAEIVAMVMMLCGRDGRFVTGQTIHVNGGLFMNN